MLDYLKRNPEKIFYFLFVLYALTGLLNLQILPIAWTDEVMNLDPALQWHKNGKYAGLLWPNKGSDLLFLSYPPLIEWVHIANLYILPFDIFWTRLPFLLFHLTAIFLVFQAFKKAPGANIWLSVVLVLLFLFDKVVFEISRSMRVEVLEVLLVASLIYLHTFNGNSKLKGMLLGLLVLAHLKMWPFVLIWLVLEWVWNKKLNDKIWLTVWCMVPTLLFLVFIKFDLNDLYNQLISQTQKHSANPVWTAKLYEYFIQRFRYVYLEQPWVFVIHIWIVISSVIQIFQSKGRSFAAFLFLGTTLAWIWFLAPLYRYWPALLLCGLWVLNSDSILQGLFKKTNIQKVFVVFIPVLISGFLIRHTLAFLQRDERNLELVHNWLRKEVDFKEKTLIVGNAAAFYMSDDKNIDYGMEIYPQNLHLDQYQKVYYLTADSLSIKRVTAYESPKIALPNWSKKFGKASSYADLKLYEIESEESWNLITQKYQNDYK